MDLGVLLESLEGSQSSSRLGHARAFSFRAVAAVSLFPSRGSRDSRLSLKASPRGFPTGLSHVPPWCESILGLKVEAVQGKQDVYISVLNFPGLLMTGVCFGREEKDLVVY